MLKLLNMEKIKEMDIEATCNKECYKSSTKTVLIGD